MFLTDRKLQRRIEELKEYRYRDAIPQGEFLAKEDLQGIPNPSVPTEFEGWEVMRTGDTWTGRDRYLWLSRTISIPAEWSERRIVGIFDYGKTGGGNNSGFESMLYLNGQPYQGVDSNHKEVFLDVSLCGQSLQAVFRLWSGLEGGGVPMDQEHSIRQADLAWLDEAADDLYYMAAMVWETIRMLSAEDSLQHDLRNALDQAFRLIDWMEPGSEAFYHSLSQADAVLNERIDGMEKSHGVSVFCVGHTHIDVAWLWRLKHTREKASRSFATVLRLMEQYPEYLFLQSQPQLYAYIKQDFPEIYQRIQQKIADGQWEVDGGMWVEADCNLTSGESLTRQLLIGSRFMKEEFAKDPNYLWLPDVFGYSWALPQILKKSGIDVFMTTKISWNQYNRMPHDTFWWKGIDGSEVLTHFITTPEPGKAKDSWFYTYNGLLEPETVKGIWEGYKDKEINQDLLLAYGYGDGGGGVNRDALEQRRRMERIPGLPSVQTSTAKAYFDRLMDNVQNTEQYVHTWDGELYLEYHRGTYTSQGYNKRQNRKMELLYRRTEWMSVMEGIYRNDLAKAQQETLTEGWKKMLTNQFHDIIPGSSIREVYEDSHKDYDWIRQNADGVEQSFYQTVQNTEDHSYTIWNSSGWTMDQLVMIEQEKDGYYEDEEGNRLPVQQEGGETYIQVQNVPSLGYRTIQFHESHSMEAASVLVSETVSEEAASIFQINEREIETPFYQIRLNESGQIARLYDKTYSREVIPEGERANVLQIFEDKPLDNDAWDIDLFYQQNMQEVTNLVQFGVKECGILRLVIHMKWVYGKSLIEQDMILYRQDRRIDFETKVDYHQRHQLLKAAFPTAIRTTYGTYDIQYGNVRRPNHWNTSWDQARFETVAHRWVDLSERDYGVSLINDCKYGHDIKGNVMRISLLRAATHPDWNQDQGEHKFTYAILPHGGDFVEGKTVQSAFALNEPMQVKKGRCQLNYQSFLSLNTDQVEVDAVKKSEDGKSIVIRFHEFAGSTKQVEMKLGCPIASWTESDLMERPIGVKSTKPVIAMQVHPYEIKTVLIEI